MQSENFFSTVFNYFLIHLQLNKQKIRFHCTDNNSICEFSPRNQFEGFLGQYYSLKVTLFNKKLKKVENLNFFVKLLPNEGAQCDFVLQGQCFDIELGLYRKIFPKLLPQMEESIPTCYFGIEKRVIVLEDLSLNNYKINNKLDFLNLEQSEIVFQTMARFHAKSINFQEKNEMSILNWCHQEKIGLNLNEATFQWTIDYFTENLIVLLDCVKVIDKVKRKKYIMAIKKIAENHYKTTSPIENEINVLCHVDLWINNILFKYENQKVSRCCFIDFQMAR